MSIVCNSGVIGKVGEDKEHSLAPAVLFPTIEIELLLLQERGIPIVLILILLLLNGR